MEDTRIKSFLRYKAGKKELKIIGGNMINSEIGKSNDMINAGT